MARALPITLPPPSELRRLYTGEGLWFTRVVTRRIGSSMVGPAYRLNLTPNQVSFIHLVLAALVSAAVIGTYQLSPIAAALVALAGWHFACGLDSTDGILARATDQMSPEGSVVDQLCDLMRTVVIVGSAWYLIAASGLEFSSPWLSSFLPAATTGAWAMPVFFIGVARTAQMKTGGRSLPFPLNVLRHTRDTGLHLTALAIAIPFCGEAMLGVLIASSAIDSLSICARMAKYVLKRPAAA
jgi:phosphatidylglycerophosphate synthase